MPSSTQTRVSRLVLSASVIANAVLGGNALYVAGTQHVTGNITGSGSINVSGRIEQPAGYVAVTGTFSGSGQKAIQNPLSVALKCGAPTVRVTTAASPSSMVDAKLAAGPGDVGNTIFDNLQLGTGLKTASGTTVSHDDGQLYFQLDEAGGTNDYIYFSGATGTGQGLAATFHMDCYKFN